MSLLRIAERVRKSRDRQAREAPVAGDVPSPVASFSSHSPPLDAPTDRLVVASRIGGSARLLQHHADALCLYR